MSIKPTGDKLLVKPVQKKETIAGGIHIPESASKGDNNEGTVVAIGTGQLDDGTQMQFEVKVGDRIVFSAFAATEVKDNGEKLLLIRHPDVLGVIE